MHGMESIATDCFFVNSIDARCFAGNSGIVKVNVCHRTGSATNPWVQICIAQATVPTHLSENHLDYPGKCGSRLDNPLTGVEGIFVYPNPAGNNVTVEFDSPASETYHLTLFDMTGREVMNSKGHVLEGGNSINIPLDEISLGVYNLRLTLGDASSFVKLIIAK